MADSRSHRVLCLLAGLWIINAFDLVLTILAYRNNLLDEYNPIAARVLPLGAGMLCIYKSVLVASASAVLVWARRQLLAEMVSGAMLIVYAMVAVHWKVCYETYEVTHTNSAGAADLGDPTGWAAYIPF